jgi:hypothetical protein
MEYVSFLIKRQTKLLLIAVPILFLFLFNFFDLGIAIIFLASAVYGYIEILALAKIISRIIAVGGFRLLFPLIFIFRIACFAFLFYCLLVLFGEGSLPVLVALVLTGLSLPLVFFIAVALIYR